MSAAFDIRSIPVLQQEYATKAELHYGFRISFLRIARVIRDANIEPHLIDGKIQFKVAEFVEKAAIKKTTRTDLFA